MPATQSPAALAVLTLSDLLARALANATSDGGGTDGVSFIDPAFGGGLCILVSGEGAKRKTEIDALAAHLTTILSADAVKIGTDVFEDYEGGSYTCLWLNLDAAEAAVDRLAA